MTEILQNFEKHYDFSTYRIVCVSKAAYFCGSWREKRNIGPETQFTLRPSFFSQLCLWVCSLLLPSSRSFSSSWALKLHGFAISSFHCKKGQSHTAFSLHFGGLVYRILAKCNCLSYIHYQINHKSWAKHSLEFVESFCTTVYIRKAITYSPAASA